MTNSLVVVLVSLSCLFLVGCGDDGGRTSVTVAPGIPNSDPGQLPGGTGGSSGVVCEPLPTGINILTWEGCHGPQNFSGIYRNYVNRSSTDNFFMGNDHYSVNGEEDGHTLLISKPDSNECGPYTLVLISEEFLQISFTGTDNTSLQAEFYTVDYAKAVAVWLELKGQDATVHPHTDEWSRFIITIVECKLDNSSCELKNLSTEGQQYLSDAVSPPLVNSSARGEFCFGGPTQVVAMPAR